MGFQHTAACAKYQERTTHSLIKFKFIQSLNEARRSSSDKFFINIPSNRFGQRSAGSIRFYRRVPQPRQNLVRRLIIDKITKIHGGRYPVFLNI